MRYVQETWVSGFGSAVEKWVFGKIEHGFSSFIAKKFAKNEEKPCSTYPFLQSPWHFQKPEGPKLRFRVPDLSLRRSPVQNIYVAISEALAFQCPIVLIAFDIFEVYRYH